MEIQKIGPSDLSALLAIAMTAAEDASREIMKVYGSKNFQTQYKEDYSPVTLADKLAHDAIEKKLNSTGLPILSEEGKNILYDERRHWKHFWLVDPLDGTKEFLKRNGEFTINIAMVSDSAPVLGIVKVPVTGELYYGVKGQGSFYKSNGIIVKLKERPSIDLSLPGLRVVASRSHMNQETLEFVQRLREPKLVNVGSSLKFMAVAKGDADVYPRYTPCMEWDTAAADVIIREVGLTIRKVHNDQPLQYNKENLLNPFFI
jgi:3'(2'), 5'-bisphosphate nucleotidase